MAAQVSAIPTGTEPETKEQDKNAVIEMSTDEPEELKTDEPKTTENLVINVEQVQTGQNLPISTTEEVGEYGNNDDATLLLLCLLLGIPVVFVVY